SRVVMTGAPASKDYANPWAPRVSIDREDGLVRARSVGPPESHAPLAKGGLDPRVPLVAAILPVPPLPATDGREGLHQLDAHDVLGHLVAELALDAQTERRAVLDRQRAVVDLVREDGLGMERVVEVDALVVPVPGAVHTVCAVEDDVPGSGADADLVENSAQRDSRPLGDRAPPLHTIVARDLRPRRKPPEALQRKARGTLHQPVRLEPPRREPGSGERLVVRVLGAGRAVAGKYRRPVGLGEFPGHGPARPERPLDPAGQPLGAFEEGGDRRRARQAVAAGEQAERDQLERAASELPAIKSHLNLHLAARKPVDASRGSSTAHCSRSRSPGP